MMERDFKDMLSALSDEKVEYDVITSIDGVEFDEAWPNRLEIQLDGLAAMVIGRDELLKNKKSTGRPKDVGDANLLEKQKVTEKS